MKQKEIDNLTSKLDQLRNLLKQKTSSDEDSIIILTAKFRELNPGQYLINNLLSSLITVSHVDECEKNIDTLILALKEI